MAIESPDQERQDRKILSLIESASGLAIILRKILTPGFIEVGPLEEDGEGPGVGSTISLERLFHLKGMDDKLGEIFDREQDKPGYKGFAENGKQNLANLLGKRIDVLYQQGGMDPYTMEVIQEDADKAALETYRKSPYATGTWYPEVTNNPT